jgi:selenocysteine lyase/cysteine desulfurase
VTVRHAPLEKLAESIGPATTMVAYALVQSADGQVAPVEPIREAASAVGAITLCDVTQAAGWLPFDAGRHDITVVAAYKWLCSPRGVAFMTLSDDVAQRLRPLYAGWYAGASVWDSIYGHDMRLAPDARRFDLSPAWLCWAGAATALEPFAQADLRAVHDHDVGLADRVLTAMGREPGGSAIISLPDGDGTLLPRFAQAGLAVAGRAGRVRLGFHIWNDEDDAQRVLDVTRGSLW